MATGNIDNLVDQSMRTKEEQRDIAIKGGIASGKARRRKKTMQEMLEHMLSMPIKDEKDIEKVKENFPDASDEDMDIQFMLLSAMIDRSKKGNTRAFEAIRDTAGEKPVERVEVVTPVNETSQKIEEFMRDNE